eukprot:scaffold83358_cov56-Attheya_sp.AAC.1
MDGSIHGWRNGGWAGWFAGIVRVAAEIEVASSSTASFGFGKIGGVAMNFEARVAHNVANCGLWLGGTGDEHGGIDCSAIVKESAHNFLDSSDGWGFKRVSGVDRNRELLFGSIGWRDPSMGSMLGSVPLESEATVEFAGPVGGDGVLGAGACKEMIGMFLADILDGATIVNNQTECDGLYLMCEETWGVLGLVVSRGFEVLDKVVVGKDASLGQAINAFTDFYNDIAIMDE